ncbi:MAG: hypothetical protein ABI346_05310 [Candidatus Baltobacteraceae bacterium]|jgi:hypothetical protein
MSLVNVIFHALAAALGRAGTQSIHIHTIWGGVGSGPQNLIHRLFGG